MANQLVKERSNLRINWFVSQSGKDYVLENGSAGLKRVSEFWIYNDDQAISLRNANKSEFYQNYKSWCERLGTIDEFLNSTISLSDNIAAPLAFRPDTKLLGSFLWSDILQPVEENRGVIDDEMTLLNSNKPEMLHIQNFGMPALNEQTTPVPLPWVTKKSIVLHTERPNILITSGKSGADLDWFASLALELWEMFPNQTFVDGALHSYISQESKPAKFSFTESGFMRLGVVVCRPGIGIITEAVTYNIPLVVPCDLGNAELDFNASVIEREGIGLIVSKHSNSKLIIDKIRESLVNGDLRSNLLSNLVSQQDGGAEVAAKYILDSLSHD